MTKLTDEEYGALYKEFKEECSEIAEGCEEEFGYAYGSNYELRKEQLMESDHYWPLFHEDEETENDL